MVKVSKTGAAFKHQYIFIYSTYRLLKLMDITGIEMNTKKRTI